MSEIRKDETFDTFFQLDEVEGSVVSFTSATLHVPLDRKEVVHSLEKERSMQIGIFEVK